MRLANVADQKDKLIYSAPMRDLVGRKLGQAHLGDQLVYKNDDADGADETSQERPAEYVVKKAEAENAGRQNKGTSQGSHDAGDFRVAPAIFVAGVFLLDVLTNHLARQKRARCFRADHHLRTSAEDAVYQGVYGKAVQAVDGRDMGKVGGVGERHGDVERGHGQGGNEVAFEVPPLILLGPVDDGNIIGNVPAQVSS